MSMLSAFGPFVTDFYLPALPALCEAFGSTASVIQLSITFSMLGLGIGQLVFGPISDRFGRRRPLQLSLVLFCISTIGCVFSTTAYTFIIYRLLQGLGGAGGLVIARAVATDLYEGKKFESFFVLLSIVQGIAPVCAPVLGGLTLLAVDWRGIFAILLVLGFLLLGASVIFRESLALDKRKSGSAAAIAGYYVRVMRNGRFLAYVFIQAFALGVMFCYIAASPFIFQDHYGLSSSAYGFCFGLNAVGIMIGSIAVPKFRSIGHAMAFGACGTMAMSVAAAAALACDAQFLWVEVPLFLLMLFTGMILPTSAAFALDTERANSGYASALLGFMSFLFGGIVSPLSGLGDIMISTGCIMVLSCACCLALTIVAQRSRRKA